ncbi:hypothetical protein ACTS9T_10840 [Empedobacter falsenii]
MILFSILLLIVVPVLFFIYYAIEDYRDGNKEKLYIFLILSSLLLIFILFLYNVDDSPKDGDNTELTTSFSPTKEEIYKIQFGNFPDSTNIKVLEAHYWESAHWSYEYKTFLKLNVKKEWIDKQIVKKQLKIYSKKDPLPELNNSPNWFTPSKNHIIYLSAQRGQSNYRIYYDSISKEVLYFDMQL